MDTEKKTGERIGITLALLACVGFSAFLIWLQQSQENDRQQLTQQVQDSGQREEQTEGSGQIEIRSRVTRSKTGDQPVFSLPGGFYPEDIMVEIAAPAGSSIYYTLDGTVPDPENGILYEAPVEMMQERFGLNRRSAVIVIAVFGGAIALMIQGIVSGWMDAVSIYICPLGAMLAAIMFFWVAGEDFALTAVNKGTNKPIGGWFIPLGRFVLVPAAFIALVAGALLGGIG